MYHVSTYLPYTPNDTQQVERKRHIGNNVVNIVFIQGDTPISPTFMATQFTHIFVIVQPITPKVLGIESTSTTDNLIDKNHRQHLPTHYRVAVCCKKDVPFCSPEIPQPGVFYKDELREFLLAKGLLYSTQIVSHFLLLNSSQC
jgi:hypothetical protein